MLGSETPVSSIPGRWECLGMGSLPTLLASPTLLMLVVPMAFCGELQVQ